MASPANKSTAASLAGALTAVSYQEAKLHGGQDDTCDPRAKYIRDVFTAFRGTVKEETNRLNMSRFNGGAEQMTLQTLRGWALVQPKPEDANYRTFLFLTDQRADLVQSDGYQDNDILLPSVLASKFAYENEKAAADLVKNKLEGDEYKFFNCPNVLLGKVKSTQAIGFVREENGRDVVYVAFRGSELFQAADWEVNFDCGHVEMGKGYGKVHKGFMKALGLLRDDTDNFDEAFPIQYPDPMEANLPAYYAIKKWINTITRLLTTPRLRVVGHSQGGALAILFVAMLLYHQGRCQADSVEVITMGQPRVGDSVFADRMTKCCLSYRRMVYRHDPVPRVPFDDAPLSKNSYSRYRHFGRCLYYKGWYRRDELEPDEPMPNENFEQKYFEMASEEKKEDASKGEKQMARLGESFLTSFIRAIAPFPVQFHSLTEYLNAARYGGASEPRGFHHALLHLLSCCNRNRVLMAPNP